MAADKAAGERQAAAGSSSAAACQREQHLLAQLAAAQQDAAAKLAEADKHWGLKLALAEERHLKVCELLAPSKDARAATGAAAGAAAVRQPNRSNGRLTHIHSMHSLAGCRRRTQRSGSGQTGCTPPTRLPERRRRRCAASWRPGWVRCQSMWQTLYSERASRSASEVRQHLHANDVTLTHTLAYIPRCGAPASLCLYTGHTALHPRRLAPGCCPSSFAGELLRHVAEVEAAGQLERERRREVEAALAEASAIFQRELADKSGQLELLRQEIRWVRMWGRGHAGREWQAHGACVWVSNLMQHHAAVAAHTRLPCAMRCRFLRTWGGNPGAVADGSARDAGASLLLPGHLAAAVAVAPLSPCRSASPGAASLCSPTFCHASGKFGHSERCFSAPVSPAPLAGAGTVTAAAARAVDDEVRALRSARRAYQRAALGQQELSANMARSIHDALRQDAPQVPLARPHSAGSGMPARRKWKRDLAAELVFSRAAAAGGGQA